MFDHTRVNVADFEASKRFYTAALAPPGYELLLEFHGSVVGFGEQGKPDFWIGQGEANMLGFTSLSTPIPGRKSRRSTYQGAFCGSFTSFSYPDPRRS